MHHPREKTFLGGGAQVRKRALLIILKQKKYVSGKILTLDLKKKKKSIKKVNLIFLKLTQSFHFQKMPIK